MVSTEEIFQDLQNIPENQICFECGPFFPPYPPLNFKKGDKSNSWASTNNGIFLCLKCSSIHRNLGTNFSFIRSINLDSWYFLSYFFLFKMEIISKGTRNK